MEKYIVKQSGEEVKVNDNFKVVVFKSGKYDKELATLDIKLTKELLLVLESKGIITHNTLTLDKVIKSMADKYKLSYNDMYSTLNTLKKICIEDACFYINKECALISNHGHTDKEINLDDFIYYNDCYKTYKIPFYKRNEVDGIPCFYKKEDAVQALEIVKLFKNE